jgi:hypothetical protein
MERSRNTTGRASKEEREEKTVHVEVDVGEDRTINVDVDVGREEGAVRVDVDVGVGNARDDDWAGPRQNDGGV